MITLVRTLSYLILKKKCYSILFVFFPLHQAAVCRHQTPSPLCPCGARAEACALTSPQLPQWSLQILSEQVELGRQMYQQLEVDAEFFSRSGRSIRITVQLSHHRSLNFKKELRYPQVEEPEVMLWFQTHAKMQENVVWRLVRKWIMPPTHYLCWFNRITADRVWIWSTAESWHQYLKVLKVSMKTSSMWSCFWFQ